ncbi:MAG TPA: glycosyltransferase [Herpetosiphonaceae bacterium]|nr:glycosyltransferase [Herpetosiphonaceae bacterium]
MKTPGRVAIVHDYLNQYGGAERVLEDIHELYPDAPVFVAIYDPDAMPDAYRSWDIRPSWMQSLPGWRRLFRSFFPLYPSAFESFDLTNYDLIISSSSGYAKGIIPAPDAVHVCYCHTPMRFAWRTEDYLQRESVGGLTSRIVTLILPWLRTWDVVTATRVDAFIANSGVVAQRIRRYYGREAVVIPPPVDLPPYEPVSSEEFYLTGGRLVPYKRIDVAVRACTALRLPLVVFGDGRARADLEAIAGPTVQFVGYVDEPELRDLYRRCRAYITAADEDAGIQPVEAMAAGRPVIGYAAGGVLQSVIEDRTGMFFHEQDAAALAVALAASRYREWDADAIRAHAEQFSRERFREQLREAIAAAISQRHGSGASGTPAGQPGMIQLARRPGVRSTRPASE